jgi:restriction endonuclease Mrr
VSITENGNPRFSKNDVAHIEKRIVLIDGAQLSEMLIDLDVGSQLKTPM